MKRKIDELVESFEAVKIEVKRRKVKRRGLKDPFKIGEEVPETLTNSEVIDLINKREQKLYEMFREYDNTPKQVYKYDTRPIAR